MISLGNLDFDKIVAMQFGSKVYGTALPTSEDIKFLFLPTANKLLLGKPETHTSMSTGNDHSRNSSEDVDIEGFSVARFLDLASAGQTVAVDMLFTPPRHWYGTIMPAWGEIIANRHRIISKNVKPFVGYCRAQLTRYCIKADRMDAVTEVCSVLAKYKDNQQLKDCASDLIPLAGDYISVDPDHLTCCGRKVAWGQHVSIAKKVYGGVLSKYGGRATVAQQSGGIDWKAVYHAVRIIEEAKELLATGHITFPRPEAEYLLRIRTEQIPFEEIQDVIEEGVKQVDEVAISSSLQEEPQADCK